MLGRNKLFLNECTLKKRQLHKGFVVKTSGLAIQNWKTGRGISLIVTDRGEEKEHTHVCVTDNLVLLFALVQNTIT